MVCKICEQPLKRNSQSCNELAVVAVLACGHVYHANCLEQRTSLEELHDPSCPVCAGTLAGRSKGKEQE